MEKLQDDLLLACSVRHGLDNWEMVADKFSKAIFQFRRCVVNLSSAECQIKYENLKERFKNLYQTNFDEKDGDESAFVKWMADNLTKTYITALKEILKPIEKNYYILFELEAKKKIADEKKTDDKSNNKMNNINQDFIEVLDMLRSHKYCCHFESRLFSQETADYINQINQHMDLQIIQNKLEQGVYSNMKISSFFKDLLLMFNNAIIYYPKNTLQYFTAFELKAIIVKEMGKKPLFRREIVCALPAIGNTMLNKQKMEKKKRNKAQEGDQSSVKKSARLKK